MPLNEETKPNVITARSLTYEQHVLTGICTVNTHNSSTLTHTYIHTHTHTHTHSLSLSCTGNTPSHVLPICTISHTHIPIYIYIYIYTHIYTYSLPRTNNTHSHTNEQHIILRTNNTPTHTYIYICTHAPVLSRTYNIPSLTHKYTPICIHTLTCKQHTLSLILNMLFCVLLIFPLTYYQCTLSHTHADTLSHAFSRTNNTLNHVLTSSHTDIYITYRYIPKYTYTLLRTNNTLSHVLTILTHVHTQPYAMMPVVD